MEEINYEKAIQVEEFKFFILIYGIYKRLKEQNEEYDIDNILSKLNLDFSSFLDLITPVNFQIRNNKFEIFTNAFKLLNFESTIHKNFKNNLLIEPELNRIGKVLNNIFTIYIWENDFLLQIQELNISEIDIIINNFSKIYINYPEILNLKAILDRLDKIRENKHRELSQPQTEQEKLNNKKASELNKNENKLSPDELKDKRKVDLQIQITNLYTLLDKYEHKLIVEDDPKRKLKYETDISDLKEKIGKVEKELESLESNENKIEKECNDKK